MPRTWRGRGPGVGLMVTFALGLSACDLAAPPAGGVDPVAPAAAAADPAAPASEPSEVPSEPLPPEPLSDRSGLTFESTFEDGNLDEWAVSQQACDYSNEIVSDVVRAGTRADRFEMRPQDAGGCAAYDGEGKEAYGGAKSDLRADAPEQQDGEYYYGFSVLLPEGFAASLGDAPTILWQLHAGFPARPSVALVAESGQLHLSTSHGPDGCGDTKGDPGPSQVLGPVVQGEWTDYLVHIDLDLGGGGDRVELLTRDAGQPAYEPAALLEGSIGYCDVGPARIGIYNPRYRSAADKHGGPTVVYFDEYREGTTQAAVETAAGGGTTG